MNIAHLLTNVALQPTQLVQDAECIDIMRIARREPPGTADNLWPVLLTNSLGCPPAFATVRINPTSHITRFQVHRPLEVKNQKQSSLTRYRNTGATRALIVVFEPPGSGGGGGEKESGGGPTGGKNGTRRTNRLSSKLSSLWPAATRCLMPDPIGVGKNGTAEVRGSNLFLPLEGFSKTVDLANIARDAAEQPGAWRQICPVRGELWYGPHSAQAPPSIVSKRQHSEQCAHIEMSLQQARREYHGATSASNPTHKRRCEARVRFLTRQLSSQMMQ